MNAPETLQLHKATVHSEPIEVMDADSGSVFVLLPGVSFWLNPLTMLGHWGDLVFPVCDTEFKLCG